MNRVLHEGWRVAQATQVAGVSLRIGYKWLARFKTEGETGLADRSSRPRPSPASCDPAQRERFQALRRQRWTFRQIAADSGRSLATLSRYLRRDGLSRLVSCCTWTPRNWARSTDEVGTSCAQFLREAVAYYAGLGVWIDRVVTDNGSGYVSKAFKATGAAFGVRHIHTRPYTPKTNGKAERFVQTSLREWAYAQPYESSAQPRPPCGHSSIDTTGIGHTQP